MEAQRATGKSAYDELPNQNLKLSEIMAENQDDDDDEDAAERPKSAKSRKRGSGVWEGSSSSERSPSPTPQNNRRAERRAPPAAENAGFGAMTMR